MIATDNTTVAAYINKQGRTHSHKWLRLVVDLFLWLQTLDIAIRARHIPGLSKHDRGLPISAESAHKNRVESPPRNSDPDLRDMGNSNSGHVCHSPHHASSQVYVSNLGASSTGDRCSVTRLAGEVDVHVSTVPPAQQSHSETQNHPRRRSDTNNRLVAVTTMVSTSTTSVCGPPVLLSIGPEPTVTRGVYLGQQVVPFACLEALMQQQTECTMRHSSLTGPQDKEFIRLVPQLLK